MAKILLFDIENSPSIGYVWGKYQQDVIDFHSEWYMMSFAYKWLGDKKVKAKSLPDYKTYKKDPKDDRELVAELWGLFDEADILVAHNGDRFDIKKANARFAAHHMKPPSPYKSVDTVKIARKYFLMNSNKLDHIGRYLDLGRKVETGGFNLWLQCMKGDMKAWKKMVEYNKQDVVLLEEVYTELRPWMGNHPNLNIINGEDALCPVCQSTSVVRRGKNRSKTGWRPRLQCMDCGAWHSGELVKYEV